MHPFAAAARALVACAICGFCSGLIVCSDRAASADLGPALPPPEPITVVAAGPQWTVQATSYLWLPFLTGDITVRARPANIDITPVEVLGHLTDRGEHLPAWMSYIEARRGPLSFYNDIFYANLGLSGSDVRTPRGRADIGASLGLDYEQAVVEVGGPTRSSAGCPVQASRIRTSFRVRPPSMSLPAHATGISR